MRRSLIALGLLASLLLVDAAGVAQSRTEAGDLRARLAALVEAAGLGDRLGVAVVALPSGREIYTHRQDLPLNPASNMKILTAATALSQLGSDFTMLTGLYGRMDADGGVHELALRGFGDPTLRMSDLVEMAEGIADQGVTRVDQVLVDGSYFDGEILPPAFDQQPTEVAAFRAPIAAVSVERNACAMRIMPGTSEGSAARVRLAASGYFDVDNGVTTSSDGGPNVIADQRAAEGRLALRLRGTVPLGITGVTYRRRVEEPLHFAGHAMADALTRVGIRGRREVRVAATPDGAPLLTARRSAPLGEILPALGKHSDNFVAEMLLKVIGAERARPGTSARGLDAVRALLVEAGGGEPRGASLVNGSGLFVGNLVSARQLVQVLAHTFRQPALRPDFLAQLAVAGVDGTLARRMTDLPRGTVRAKTGTLNDVIALSGYAIGQDPGRAYAFSVLVNGATGKHGAARHLCDAIAIELANDVGPGRSRGFPAGCRSSSARAAATTDSGSGASAPTQSRSCRRIFASACSWS